MKKFNFKKKIKILNFKNLNKEKIKNNKINIIDI